MKSPIRQETPHNTSQNKKERLTKKTALPVSNQATTTSFFDRIPWIGQSSSISTITKELGQINEAVKEDYLKRFAHIAVKEQAQFGIPASIVLANALLHSQAHQRDLTRVGHNHFALRCTTNWEGKSATYQGTCYRHYSNNWESFRDHSFFITTGAYQHLMQLGKKDYKAWANGLEAADFSEEPNLAEHLIQLIEQYKLYKLDEE